MTAREAGHIDVEVLLGARDREQAQAAAELLVDEGLAVKPRVLDVTSRGSIVAAIEAIDSGNGRLGILVNAMCPGWVKTEMGRLNAVREIEDSVDTAIAWSSKRAINVPINVP